MHMLAGRIVHVIHLRIWLSLLMGALALGT